MSNRDAKHEIEVLINDLGLPENEALNVLGLESAADPLLTAEPDLDALDRERPLADTVSDMFPEIPHEIIIDSLREYNNDPEKASEYLLNWTAVKKEEAQNWQTTRETKQERKMRKQRNKHQKAVDNEEKDIALIAATLKVSAEESRALYWSHENNVSEALLAKIPRQPVISETQLGQKRPSANDPFLLEPGVSELSEYNNMNHRELKALLDSTERKKEMLRSKSVLTSKQPWDRIRASDAAAELRALNHESRIIQLALFKLEKLHSKGSIRGLHSDGMSRTVDLHGCTLDQARVVVGEALDEFIGSTACRLEFITGVGHHSAGGQAVLKPWLRNFLKLEHVRMEELEGSFVVTQTPRV